MSIKVLLVDDQSMVRAGFRMILEVEPDIEVVGEAADGAQATATARRLRPDIVLMDIQMPGEDGLGATRRITETDGLKCRVIILTTFERDDYVFEALQSSASGFLLKTLRLTSLCTPCGSWPLATPCSRRRSPDGLSNSLPDNRAGRRLGRGCSR